MKNNEQKLNEREQGILDSTDTRTFDSDATVQDFYRVVLKSQIKSLAEEMDLELEEFETSIAPTDKKKLH